MTHYLYFFYSQLRSSLASSSTPCYPLRLFYQPNAIAHAIVPRPPSSKQRKKIKQHKQRQVLIILVFSPIAYSFPFILLSSTLASSCSSTFLSRCATSSTPASNPYLTFFHLSQTVTAASGMYNSLHEPSFSSLVPRQRRRIGIRFVELAIVSTQLCRSAQRVL